MPEEEQPREDYSGLLNKLKNYLLAYYTPEHDPTKADCHFSTSEILSQLQRILPTDILTGDMVALWLHDGGFTFYDFGEMRLEWLMKIA